MPRATRLVAAATLPAFQRAIHALAVQGDLAETRSRVILVPSRAAAVQLRHTLETLQFDSVPGTGDAALALPELLTRDEWYQRMHERAGLTARRLTAIEREAMLAAAAREAIGAGSTPPFKLRPGLLAEMLGFYDTLGRNQRSLEDYERNVVGDLESRASADRGAERLLEQTRFLLAAFRAFERRIADSGALDEGALRQRLLDEGAHPGFTHIVVTVGDRAADPSGGLFSADFDLMMGLPGVRAIDIVTTRAILASGFHERLDGLVPGLEHVVAEDIPADARLIAPAGDAAPLHFTSRDREEELREIARRVKEQARRAGSGPALDRVAVVFSRPLPYVYLAGTVFEASGIQFQAADALPLAAEPMAAVLDLVFAAVESRYARGALVALLRSPHLESGDGSGRLPADEIEAFDRGLAERRYAGSREALDRLAGEWTGRGSAAARAAATLVAALDPLGCARNVSAHAATLIDFLRSRERMDMRDDAVRARHLRARGAILSVLDDIRLAALAFDDPVVRCGDLAATVRRFVEAETFSPRRGSGGVQVVDAQAARYGAFDTVFVAGLIEGDWPGPSPRNIFYPAFLLAGLGWPAESARLAAARAAFADLLSLAREATSVSAFTLEDDAIVNPSAFVEELAGAPLRVERAEAATALVFADEALALARPVPPVLAGDAARWLDLREGRTPAGAAEFHGAAGAARRTGHSVTSIDTYLQCPFKYFAAKVLELPEEVSDEPAMTPQSEGRFVHEVLQSFFAGWQASGGGAITVDVLDAARAQFAEVANRMLAELPASDAALQRARLLGSVGTPGLGELVLAAEAARPEPVRERLLEHELDGLFTIAGHGEEREVRLRGKADRIDLLDDGTFRLIDYKSGRFPDPSQTIQLPIYSVCAAQDLARMHGGAWRVREASYIAFAEPKLLRIVIADGRDADEKLADGQGRLLDALDAIDRGEFPPRPATVRLCSYCPYATVCRKDYVDAE